jgi:hypothetical protein
MIKNVSSTLRQLSKYCAHQSIEKLIAALIAKDSIQIEIAVNELLETTLPTKQTTMFQAVNVAPKKEVIRIIHQDLPNFWKKYLPPICA